MQHFKGKHILIIVENLPVPFDRRVWEEANTLKSYGAEVSIICPRIKGYTKKYEEINGIHIYRHPFAVVPSTIKMWNIFGTQNCLNNKWTKPGVSEVTILLDKMLTKIREDFSCLPKKSYCEVRFEDLELNPVGIVRRIYKEFDIKFTYKNESIMEDFLTSIDGYKKSTYFLTFKEKKFILKRLGDHMKYYKYID